MNAFKVIVWNCRRANINSSAWDYLLTQAPDVMLLQEVVNIPPQIKSVYNYSMTPAMGKTGKPQKFNTAVLVKGEIEENITLSSQETWVSEELGIFSGNLIARRVKLSNGLSLKTISVYYPAWPINRERLANIDTTGIQLTQNRDLWVGDLLWATLKQFPPDPNEPWIIGGDFNLSETFDLWAGGPRGNREYLDRMASLGLIESLRYSQGRLTPTFRNTGNQEIKHQMDHLFTTKILAQNLIRCVTGQQNQIFDNNLSDHLPIIADFNLIENLV